MIPRRVASSARLFAMPTVHPTVHPTAVLEGSVELQGDASVGPNCMLFGPITIGPGTRLIGQVFLQGPLTLGADNLVFPFVCLGFAPQHLKFDRDKPGPGLSIGSGNTFREHVTVHRASPRTIPRGSATGTTSWSAPTPVTTVSSATIAS